MRYVINIFLLLFLSMPSISIGETKEPIKIGAMMALTGQFAMQGTAFTEGIEIAVDELNENGGIRGRSVSVIIEDSHGDAKSANNAASKLLEVDKVVAGITCSYPETKVGGGRFQKAGVPTIALWDSSPEIDNMGDYVFSLGPWILSSGEKAADYAHKQLDAKTAIIVNTIEEWSDLVPDYFKAEFEKSGGKVLERFRSNPESSDYRTIVTRIKTLNPDVIYAPLTHNIVPFHQQLKSMRVDIPVISSDIIADEHLQQAPSVLEGVYQTNVKDPENSISQKLFARYQKKFGRAVTQPWFVATGYDAVMTIAAAAKMDEPTAENIKSNLYKVKDYPGAAQNITINEKGSSPQMAKMFKVENGKFEYAG